MAQGHRDRTRAVTTDGAACFPPGGFYDGILRYGEFWEDPPPVEMEQRLASDLGRLQGAWTTVSGRRSAELLISGQHLTIHFQDGEIYMGSFTLGAAGRRTTLDVRIDEGPSRHRGLLTLCLCELQGDTLRWCNASPGNAERPLAFDEQNPHLLCLMLRREHRTEVR